MAGRGFRGVGRVFRFGVLREGLGARSRCLRSC